MKKGFLITLIVSLAINVILGIIICFMIHNSNVKKKLEEINDKTRKELIEEKIKGYEADTVENNNIIHIDYLNIDSIIRANGFGTNK